ncbi:MAG TPA: polymer-forming cytoskeletal protein [Pseudomonadales bacterium]|nr:polymer-forming cytoskeletal protein [Pseudomonadales bacterium]
MFGNKVKQEAGITLIASNCEITGDVYFSDQLQVNGVVKGNIHAQEGSKALVTISEKGRVNGEIRVPNVIVNGKVVGDIYSDKHVELAAKAEIKGNVFYSLIEMVMGSRVDGKLVHIKTGKEIKQNTDVPAAREQGSAPAAAKAANPETPRQNPQPQSTQSQAPKPAVTAVPGKAV